jgi:TonB-linked SusC/RagA family outer membrane protein
MQYLFSKASIITLLLILTFGISAQSQINITGTIFDEAGETLPGVNILLKGQDKGTISDFDGKFGISVPNANAILVFSYLGYQTVEIKVDRTKPMVVKMVEETKSLSEVMVIGYQDVRKRDLTGSVAKANIEDMLKAPVASFDQALSGRIAGVNVSSGEGTPGGTMNIVIRGKNSLTQDNSPLFIIDGFPVEDPAAGSSVNPNDIESIDVLKDASATAIYGARGANGVIIITTKKGTVGEPSISYDGSFGVQRVIRTIPMMDAYEFVKLQTEVWTPEQMSGDFGYFKTYEGKTYSLEDYRDVEQYNWQDGIVLASNYNRIQGRLGTTIRRDKLNINLTTNYSRATQQGSSPSQSQYSGMNNLFYSVWGYRPITQPGVDISTLLDNATDDGVDQTNDYRFNPIMSLNNEHRKNITAYNQYNGFLEYEFIKGLKLKVSGGYTIDNRRNENFNNSKTRYGSPISNDKVNATFATSERKTWLNENIMTYQVNLDRKHFINALIGMTMQESVYEFNSMKTINIPNESLGMAGMWQGTPNLLLSSKSEWSMLSYLARINYNYQSKYYFTASFRADGSSKFAKKNRYGYFPSTSVAWNFTEEEFLKDYSYLINSGKLRLSWGATGNNRVGDYDTYAQLELLQASRGNFSGIDDVVHGVYPFNNNVSSVGAVPTSLANRDLKWETTTQSNIGFDLSFLKDRINFTFDWYDKITSDLLLRATLPTSSGYGSAMKNIGKVRNQGVEFTLNTTNIKTRDFSWSTNFNIGFNDNSVLELTENQLSMLTNGYFDQNYTSPNYIAKIGYPIGMMYGYVYEGTYKLDDFTTDGSNYYLKPGIPYYTAENNTQPGYPRYADINEDGKIDTNDQTFIGQGEPVHVGGFTNNFTYKAFDLSIFFQWSSGSDILNANKLMFESGYNKRRDLNQYASFIDRWTFDNQDSDIPRVSASPSNNLFSTRLIEDGSYLRLKTLSVGYTFDKSLLKKLKLKNARIYISGQNLLTLTRYSGYDPEVSIRNSALTPGLDFSAYPRAMSVNMGLNLNF